MESALKTARSGYDIGAVNFIASLNRLWWLTKYSLILITRGQCLGLTVCFPCPLFCYWWPAPHQIIELNASNLNSFLSNAINKNWACIPQFLSGRQGD